MKSAFEVLRESGLAASTADRMASTVRGVERRLGCRWEEATNEAVAAGAPRPSQRCHVRRYLCLAFADARTRWPVLFRGAQSARGTDDLTPENALPRDVFRMAPDAPIRQLFQDVFQDVARQHKMRSVHTVRRAFCFLYGFLFGAGESSLVPPALHGAGAGDIRSFLRRLGADDVARAYRRYHDASPRVRPVVSRAHFRRQVFLIDTLLAKIARTRHLHFTADLLTGADGWVREPQKRGGPRVHCFTAAEVRALYLACEGLFEKLLLTALFTTGMRIGGFTRASAKETLRPDGSVGGEWWTTEKGDRWMNYTINGALAALLGEWVASRQHSARFLFPSDRDPDRHTSETRVYKTFMAVAQRAKVEGRHVHPHTTRHTFAWTLCALGNKVDDIAQMVGHGSSQVTAQVYIALTSQEVSQRMVIPWLRNAGPGSTSLSDSGYQLASALAGPFGSADQRTFPDFRPPPPNREDGPPRKKKRRLGREALQAFLQRLERGADEAVAAPP